MTHCTVPPAGEDLRPLAASRHHGWVTAGALNAAASAANICVWITASMSDIFRCSLIQPPSRPPPRLDFCSLCTSSPFDRLSSCSASVDVSSVKAYFRALFSFFRGTSVASTLCRTGAKSSEEHKGKGETHRNDNTQLLSFNISCVFLFFVFFFGKAEIFSSGVSSHILLWKALWSTVFDCLSLPGREGHCGSLWTLHCDWLSWLHCGRDLGQGPPTTQLGPRCHNPNPPRSHFSVVASLILKIYSNPLFPLEQFFLSINCL